MLPRRRKSEPIMPPTTSPRRSILTHQITSPPNTQIDQSNRARFIPLMTTACSASADDGHIVVLRYNQRTKPPLTHPKRSARRTLVWYGMPRNYAKPNGAFVPPDHSSDQSIDHHTINPLHYNPMSSPPLPPFPFHSRNSQALINPPYPKQRKTAEGSRAEQRS